jgi:FkbM family methyltransferase
MQPVVERFPWVALIYRYLRDNRFLFENPKEIQLGFKFIGNKKMEQGVYEKEETEIIRRCLKKTDVFINIGANIGYYCCIALSVGTHTIAFEPMESNLSLLYKNIKANKWERNIEVFPLAISNMTGLIEIYGGGPLASIHDGWAGIPLQYKRVVPVTTLDTALNGRFFASRCFILADIEGAEYFMLEGAEKFLKMVPKPIWMVEIQVKEHQPAGTMMNPYLLQTFQIFWENGYEAWTADKSLRKIEQQEVIDICKGKINSLSSQNFLFLDRGMINQI